MPSDPLSVENAVAVKPAPHIEVRLTFAYHNEPGESEDEPTEFGAVFSFSDSSFGFGQLILKQTPKGVFLDTECMSRERAKKYLAHLIDSAITDTEEDPEKRQLFDEAMGRGDFCVAVEEPK